jgi:hypothetical protein
VAVEKTHALEVRRKFIAPGCPINDVLDFGGHFLSLGRGSFFQKRGFFNSQRCYVNRVTGLPVADKIVLKCDPL